MWVKRKNNGNQAPFLNCHPSKERWGQQVEQSKEGLNPLKKQRRMA
jgi:hypothetical protein